MTKLSDIDQIVQGILADMPLKEKTAISNLPIQKHNDIDSENP